MAGRIFSLVFCLVFLTGCVRTVPIDKLDGKIVLEMRSSASDYSLSYIVVRDSSKIKDYYLFKHDSKNLKVGDTIRVKQKI